MADDSELVRLATEFAQDLTNTVRALVPSAPPFKVAAGTTGGVTRLFVRQDPAEGIQLAVSGIPLLRLMVELLCTVDHRELYLAVERSHISVLAIGSGEPLLRYEYLRTPTSTQAGAHVQVHAHRDAMSHVLAKCGTSSARARRRVKRSDEGERLPILADLHLPLGGPRFRPCLEDVLQMLIDEFGVDASPAALTALANGRADWRRKQLGAAVRDSPETAARVLTELGYTIDSPAVIPRDRMDRLSAL